MNENEIELTKVPNSIAIWWRITTVVVTVFLVFTYLNLRFTQKRTVRITVQLVNISSRDALGTIEIPIEGSGEIKIGHKVIIHLDNFRAIDNQRLLGEVKSISPYPVNKSYFVGSVRIFEFDRLPNTNIAEFTGTADIIIADVTLFEKLFNHQ